MDIAVIIPAYNEEASIAATVSEYIDCLPSASIIVVDNNSTDGTCVQAQKALRSDKDFYLFERQQGKGYAVSKGLSRVEADVYIMVDGDLTYPAEDAVMCLDHLVESRYDMVIGDRLSSGAYHAQNLRMGHREGNYLLTKIISFLAGRSFSDVESGMRVMSRPFVEMLALRSSGFQLEPEINLFAAYLNADIHEEPIKYRARVEGSESKLNTLGDGFKILKYIIREWLFYRPMQALTLFFSLSMIVSLTALYRPAYDLIVYGGLTAPYVGSYMVGGLFASFCGLVVIVGVILQGVVTSAHRRDTALFKESKRIWNSKLDSKLTNQ